MEWTTYHNLNLWFSSWEMTLDKLGFLDHDLTGKKIIHKSKLENILNFDEKCLSLDGSTVLVGKVIHM